METKFNFTQRRLDTLPIPEAGRVTYHDDRVPGLAIRVSSTGHKAAYLSRKVKRCHVKLKLGTWGRDITTVKNLREAAEAALGDLEGIANRRRAGRQEATLADLWERWEDYMADHKKAKSQTEDRRYWNSHLSKWARRPVSEISRADVAGLHSRVGRKHGKYTANRLLALLSAMFSEGRRTGLLGGENPCTGIRRFKEESRDRWLDGSELRAFFQSLCQEPQPFPDYFTMLLLTGARRSNLMTMRWEQVDLERGLWRIPETKGGEVVVVPLVEPALLILRRRQREANGNGSKGWIFPGRSRAGHIAPSNRVWQRICQRAGLQDARLHDLRRTLGSWMATQGTSLPVIGKSLGHRSLASTEVYARLSTDPVREAIDKATGAMLAAGGLLTGPEENGR
jgi:integrase